MPSYLADVSADIQAIIASNLSYAQIINLCQSNKQLYARCQSDAFWDLLFRVRYGWLPRPDQYNPKHLFSQLETQYNAIIQHQNLILHLSGDQKMIDGVMIGFLIGSNLDIDDLVDPRFPTIQLNALSYRSADPGIFPYEFNQMARRPDASLILTKPGGLVYSEEEIKSRVRALFAFDVASNRTNKHSRYASVNSAGGRLTFNLRKQVNLDVLFTAQKVLQFFDQDLEIYDVPTRSYVKVFPNRE